MKHSQKTTTPSSWYFEKLLLEFLLDRKPPPLKVHLEYSILITNILAHLEHVRKNFSRSRVFCGYPSSVSIKPLLVAMHQNGELAKIFEEKKVLVPAEGEAYKQDENTIAMYNIVLKSQHSTGYSMLCY